mmetsp:Transcript_3380/g.9416  ORF Transcript_3380/g.9416 Transcript_3380/m.9416 type:complete len:262 (+) Transcript_3380:54-839(+)
MVLRDIHNGAHPGRDSGRKWENAPKAINGRRNMEWQKLRRHCSPNIRRRNGMNQSYVENPPFEYMDSSSKNQVKSWKHFGSDFRDRIETARSPGIGLNIEKRSWDVEKDEILKRNSSTQISLTTPNVWTVGAGAGAEAEAEADGDTGVAGMGLAVGLAVGLTVGIAVLGAATGSAVVSRMEGLVRGVSVGGFWLGVGGKVNRNWGCCVGDAVRESVRTRDELGSQVGSEEGNAGLDAGFAVSLGASRIGDCTGTKELWGLR